MFAVRFFMVSGKDPYEIPLNKVTHAPMEAIYQYPIDGNSLKMNGTHFFLPTFQKLYSKFYMNFPYEEQKFYGFSQQLFDKQESNVMFDDFNATLQAIDHLAIVKAEGSWKDHGMDGTTSIIDETDSEEIPYSFWDKAHLYSRVYSMFLWFRKFLKQRDLFQQMHLKEQTPLLQNIEYSKKSKTLGRKLRREMKEYSSDIDKEQNKDFAMCGMTCLHMNIDVFPFSQEGETVGVWLPLNHTFLFWRAMSFFEPLGKFMSLAGVVSVHVKKDNLEFVYKGTQTYRADIEGIDYANLRLYVGPPNDVVDTRPSPPEKPTGTAANLARKAINFLGSNKRTPWAPREKLCPEDQFKSKFSTFKTECSESFGSLSCVAALSNIYPCYNYLLRSSEKFSHGIDGMLEVGVVLHVMLEFSWDFLKLLAIDIPWDEEMKDALKALNLLET